MANIAPKVYKTSELKSRITHLAQTSIYQVKVPPPPTVSSFLKQSGRGFNYEQLGENFELLCESAVLPGSATATHDVTNDYAGVSEKMVYRRMYDGNLELSFLVDHDYNVIEFFDGWMDYISGVGLTGSREAYKSRFINYRMSYPNDYKTDIYLTKFEKDYKAPGNPLDALLGRGDSTRLHTDPKQLTYTFVGAFPESVTSMPISYGGSDLLRLNVSMSYIRYVRERKTLTPSTSARNFSLFSSLFDFFT